MQDIGKGSVLEWMIPVPGGLAFKKVAVTPLVPTVDNLRHLRPEMVAFEILIDLVFPFLQIEIFDWRTPDYIRFDL